MRGKQVSPPAPFRKVTFGSRLEVTTHTAGVNPAFPVTPQLYLPPPCGPLAGRVREGVSSRRLLLRARRGGRVLLGIYGLTRSGRRSTASSTQLGQAPAGRLAAALSGLERRAVHV